MSRICHGCIKKALCVCLFQHTSRIVHSTVNFFAQNAQKNQHIGKVITLKLDQAHCAQTSENSAISSQLLKWPSNNFCVVSVVQQHQLYLTKIIHRLGGQAAPRTSSGQCATAVLPLPAGRRWVFILSGIDIHSEQNRKIIRFSVRNFVSYILCSVHYITD